MKHDPALAAEAAAGPVRARYEALVASGAIERDPAQIRLVARLDELVAAVAARQRPGKSSPLGWLFAKPEAPLPNGLYLWGSVGRGKTMLMDLFFDSLAGGSKRRVHFHAYMAEVHERIHDWRQKLKRGEVAGDDPIRPVAADLAAEARILCFDEFAVVDIADAMILGRLFTALFEHGVIVVATSNVPPDDLYKDGLNRTLFLPFIELLKERTDVLHLDARTDFRLEKLGDSPVYFAPADAAAAAAIDGIFARLTRGAAPKATKLLVQGRAVAVPEQAMGVARFPYAALCKQPLGAADYIAIARAYHTVLIEGLPALQPSQRDEARRLITLIDIFYERRVKLVVSAAAEPQDLFHAETGAEAFEFARTVSRLAEMRSRDYLALPRGRGHQVTGNVTGLVET
ncbi:MAG TPA: cell division protein ZapE [Beijerinckiaceae bacterium]|nr:cell division protein ZapE [Beijerinckiaceae bacterium]